MPSSTGGISKRWEDMMSDYERFLEECERFGIIRAFRSVLIQTEEAEKKKAEHRSELFILEFHPAGESRPGVKHFVLEG
jgi:hypothetical protein